MFNVATTRKLSKMIGTKCTKFIQYACACMSYSAGGSTVGTSRTDESSGREVTAPRTWWNFLRPPSRDRAEVLKKIEEGYIH